MTRATAFAMLSMLIVMSAASASHATLIADFESPTFTQTELAGQDSWNGYVNGPGWAEVQAYAPAYVLAGAQSVYHYRSTSFIDRVIPGGVPNGSTLSWLFAQEVLHNDQNAGEYNFAGLMDAAITGNSTAAVGVLPNNNFALFGDGTATDTGITLSALNVYLIEMELDLTTQTFDGYVTNITAAGPRTSLGTKAFNSSAPLTVAPAFGSFKAGGSAIILDNIVIPEPASAGLLAAGSLIVLRRKMRRA